jgi:hypothetical protein
LLTGGHYSGVIFVIKVPKVTLKCGRYSAMVVSLGLTILNELTAIDVSKKYYGSRRFHLTVTDGTQ